MPRPLRYFKPDGIYFITGRCLQGRLLLRPSNTTNNIIGGVLAKALSLFDIELYAFVFASNHFHMMLRSEKLQIPQFMQYLRSNIAKKIGRHVDWSGKLWDRRYDAEPVLDDAASIGRLRYILAHGVKEGLVSLCKQWPGLSSTHELLNNKSRSFSWPKTIPTQTETNPAEHRGPEYPISLTQLPCITDTSKNQRAVVAQLIEDIETEQRKLRQGKPVLGCNNILSQQPHDKPSHIKRSPRPLCHASTRETYNAYKAEYATFMMLYTEASKRYRQSEQNQSTCEFPAYSFHPPICRPIMQNTA